MTALQKHRRGTKHESKIENSTRHKLKQLNTFLQTTRVLHILSKTIFSKQFQFYLGKKRTH